MLLTQFILIDTHFVISLLAALVFFAIAWLYVDAWVLNRKMKETTLFFGFIFLAISFLAQSVVIDQALLNESIFGAGIINLIKNSFRIFAYLTLIFGQVIVPLQPVPDTKKAMAFIPLLVSNFLIPNFLIPVLSAITGFLYLRRATVGLENHQKPISLGFFLLSLSELLGLSAVFRQSNNVFLSQLVSPFGVMWNIELILLLLAVIVFGKWVFGYLLKRFDSQIFMILATSSLLIFLVTTIFFTYATLKNLTTEAYSSLKTDLGVLNYAIESKKGELISSAESLSYDLVLSTAVSENDKKVIANIATNSLVSKKENSLVVTGVSGEILYKAEDPEFSGGSLSNNSLVKRALAGTLASGMSTKDGVTAPVVVISVAVPIKHEGKVVGSVLVGYDIDNAFTDGIKTATGLDTSVYADNIRSATTFIAPDRINRYVGIKEEDLNIKKTVLSNGEVYTGTVNILNTPYFASFSPLMDTDNNPVGMLFTGRPQVSILQTAAHSLELTFIVTAALLVFSLIPSYLISKYIEGQVR